MSTNPNQTNTTTTDSAISSNSGLDKFFATLLLIFLSFGLPANIFSVRYFTNTRRQKCISTSLYIAISIIDTGSSFCHLPVMVSLFAERAPVMFESLAVCAMWEVVFSFCQRMAMFLVMTLSFTRTIAITRPFYKMKRSSVVAGVAAYGLFLAVHFALSAVVKIGFIYRAKGGYCFRNIDEQTAFTVTHMVLLNIEIGLPPIVTFVTFIICVVQLRITSVKTTEEINRRAAVTVTIFTAVFLSCNIPYFANMLLALSGLFFKDVKASLGNSTFMLYFYTAAKIHFTVLNASLNPIVYYHRMDKYRKSVRRVQPNKKTVTDVSQPQFEMLSM